MLASFDDNDVDKLFLLLIAAWTIWALRLMSGGWLLGLFLSPLSKEKIVTTLSQKKCVILTTPLNWGSCINLHHVSKVTRGMHWGTATKRYFERFIKKCIFIHFNWRLKFATFCDILHFLMLDFADYLNNFLFCSDNSKYQKPC